MIPDLMKSQTGNVIFVMLTPARDCCVTPLFFHPAASRRTAQGWGWRGRQHLYAWLEVARAAAAKRHLLHPTESRLERVCVWGGVAPSRCRGFEFRSILDAGVFRKMAESKSGGDGKPCSARSETGETIPFIHPFSRKTNLFVQKPSLSPSRILVFHCCLFCWLMIDSCSGACDWSDECHLLSFVPGAPRHPWII